MLNTQSANHVGRAEDKEEEKLKKIGMTATRGVYMGDKRDTYRHEDKDNREQEGSLC